MSPQSVCQFVSSKRVFFKTAHKIFVKLLVRLGSLKGKKLMEPDFFWKKISFWG